MNFVYLTHITCQKLNYLFLHHCIGNACLLYICLDIINGESRIHVKQFQSSTPRYNTLVATLKINITHGVNAVECLSGPSLANFSILSETIPLKQRCQWVYNGIIDGGGIESC